MDAPVLISISSEGIATITLNRTEKRNALDGPLVALLTKALHDLSCDPAVRVLLIRGNGCHFCAGADIAWMTKMTAASTHENQNDAEQLSNLLFQLYHFPKPTIALAQGTTLGGGLGLLAAADIALASETADFGFSEVKLGLAPFVISPYIIAIIGERAAHYYFLSGERFSSQQACELGLIHRLTPETDLCNAGLRLANALLENSPSAMSAIKKLIKSVSRQTITPELMHETAKKLADLRQSPEAKEGLNAFLEKRKPHWR